MGNHIPIGEKTVGDAKAEKERDSYNLWLLGIVIVAILLAYTWEYEEHEINTHQKSTITALKKRLTDQEARIRDQSEELSPLRAYAIDKFGGDEKSALAQLASEIQAPFQPLDAPSRIKAVAAFSAVRTNFGTNLISVELIVETSNVNCTLLANEWVSLLKDAGFKAVVGNKQMSTTMNTKDPILFEYDKDQFGVLGSFGLAMFEFITFPSFGATNATIPGILTVHIIGKPAFLPDGHVTFGEPLAKPGY